MTIGALMIGAGKTDFQTLAHLHAERLGRAREARERFGILHDNWRGRVKSRVRMENAERDWNRQRGSFTRGD